jgi:peptide/nickel transport system permease protein
VAVGLAVPIGVLARKARKLVDHWSWASPCWASPCRCSLLAYILIYFFAVQWRLLPVRATSRSAGSGRSSGLILPSVALGVTYMALIARITRASMLECCSGLYPHRQRQGPGDRPRAAAACAQERRHCRSSR